MNSNSGSHSDRTSCYREGYEGEKMRLGNLDLIIVWSNPHLIPPLPAWGQVGQNFNTVGA